MLIRFFCVCLVMCLSACTTTSINLPAITDAPSAGRNGGTFIWHDLISDDPAGSIHFYRELLGWEFQPFAALAGKYWTISLAGKPIGGMVAQSTLRAQRDVSQWISALSVDDPESALRLIQEARGEVLRKPVSLGDRGTVAVYADPQGAIFATLTTPRGDPPQLQAPPAVGDFLWHELWTSDVFDASSFYAALGGSSIDELEPRDAGGAIVHYNVLRHAGHAAAGVRDLPDPDMPSLWMPFLRVENLENLEDLVDKVAALGGKVLVPAVARPERGYVAVIAGPSGAPIAFQTWGANDRLRGEL